MNFLPLKCRRERVQPKKGLIRTVSLCTQAMSPLTELHDVYLEILIPLSTGAYVHGEMALGGLTNKSIESLVRTVIEHDYEAKP